MKLETVAKVVRDLRGAIPESFRTLVAHRMVNGFLNSLPNTARSADADGKVTEAFNRECNVKADLPFVNYNLQLSDSDLATFCNRWMTIEKYKDEDGQWKPFTAEMNSVRYTMVKELERMANVSNKYPDEQPETD